jgi:sugar phosphate permease
MDATRVDAPRAAAAPIGLVALLAVALLVNYIDRGSIATAAPMLEQELGLSASEMGWVLAAFYWAYAPNNP